MPLRLEARETVFDGGAPHKGCGAARNKTMGQAPLTILLAGRRGFCVGVERFGSSVPVRHFNLLRALEA
jgi:hypothetical protein